MKEIKKVIVPKYAFIEEEGVNDITPIRRKIGKTMEVTETFTYYDVIAYVEKMKKAVEDKEAEIAGMKTMIKAYEKEVELIEKMLKVTKIEKDWNLALHKKLKEEEKAKKEKTIEELVD